MKKHQIHPGFYIILVVSIFLIPIKWVIVWVLAVLIHELSHLLAVKFCGGSIQSFRVGLAGANMECTGLTKPAYAFSVLSGPVIGLLPVLFVRWMPRLAVCSCILSLYNLLPILPLDGGQVVKLIIKNKNYLTAVQNISLIFVLLFSAYLSFFTHLGPLPVIFAISLGIKNRKIPCKEATYKVQ